LLYEVNYLSKFFKMNMLEKINKSGVIKIIGKKLIVWDFSTYLFLDQAFFFFFLQKVNFKLIKIKILGQKNGFTGVFTYLYPIKGEFLQSNLQTQD
ncbi:hypothetical protein, partial [Mesomycoplasma ovipneumoniae]|uniref:hypothetical protein n=1 Tax=Mesomycoplasma ovipneumoniae TaxID=29562 RepID=UPI00308040A7